MSQLIYDPQLTKVLASIGDFVPTGMTLDRLPYFREISSPTREDLLENYPVNCVDHRIPGYKGDELVISVITRKGHDQIGPAIFFLHGGGMGRDLGLLADQRNVRVGQHAATGSNA